MVGTEVAYQPAASKPARENGRAVVAGNGRFAHLPAGVQDTTALSETVPNGSASIAGNEGSAAAVPYSTSASVAVNTAVEAARLKRRCADILFFSLQVGRVPCPRLSWACDVRKGDSL